MNVKVLLLPRGEDPDSFAKSMGASAFQQYISENETDFIRFKTRLLLEKAENDPMAKARLISDVIQSVSVIPDAIIRSVYIKECSSLLGVSEELLYTEVRKQKSKQTDDFQKREYRKKNAPPVVQTHQENIPPKEAPQTELFIEESVFLRFLIKYCNTPVFEVETDNPNETEFISAGEYMIHEIDKDDLVSENPLFQKVYYEVNHIMDKDNIDTWKYFIHHRDVDISRLATDLLSDKYIESKRWSKAGAYMEREEDILELLIPRVVAEYKFRKIKLMQQLIEDQIGQMSSDMDDEVLFDLLNNITNLKKVEKILSKTLGDRTIY